MTKLILLLMTVLAVPSALAQNLGFTDEDRCAACNMSITKHPGPKGIVKLQDGSILKFCSTRDTYCYATAPKNKDKVDAIFVHDVAKIDWAKPNDDALVDGKNIFFVYGSSKRAVMGPSVATFANKDEAEKFAKEFGGVVYEQKYLSPEFLDCQQ